MPKTNSIDLRSRVKVIWAFDRSKFEDALNVELAKNEYEMQGGLAVDAGVYSILLVSKNGQ